MSARPVIGLLVIGQAPRPALLAEFERDFGDAAELKMRGALDHLDEAGLAQAAPSSAATTLYTTLPSGRSILVDKKVVTEGMAARLAELDDLGARATFVCCTGRFPSLAAPGVHFASDLLAGAVTGCLQGGRLGIFIPTPAQAENARTRWGAKGYDVSVIAVQPDAGEEEIRDAARQMAEVEADLAVFDCISYTSRFRQITSEILPTPALLAVSVTARFAAELVGV
ncbi:AroM family protein [Tropicimonas sp. IMCC6043]|uniref:AroM family protein n=1 Tax=Tropicimonas sp. IMCC6043 TaxID=2510645 RepID=UPI00101C32B0|nr:AroM family protein [Tropicimonas sp. IMCC6043]RYH12315.1 hypothetical protein EU800_01790 [Tropicimonas sp. IMCC6043]